jgi:hypothetical protein
MTEPSLRVMNWLGDIPVEGECTSCLAVRFQVKPLSHHPNCDDYQADLKSAFDRHFAAVHARRDARQSE